MDLTANINVYITRADQSMRGSRKFCQSGSKFDNVFFCFVLFCSFNEGIEDPNANINGTSSARQRHAILMAFRWRADDCLTLNAGFVAL